MPSVSYFFVVFKKVYSFSVEGFNEFLSALLLVMFPVSSNLGGWGVATFSIDSGFFGAVWLTSCLIIFDEFWIETFLSEFWLWFIEFVILGTWAFFDGSAGGLLTFNTIIFPEFTTLWFLTSDVGEDAIGIGVVTFTFTDKLETVWLAGWVPYSRGLKGSNYFLKSHFIITSTPSS